MPKLSEIKTRLGRLSIGLFASLLIAHVITTFEVVLEANIILAAFIPMVVYMSDAVGTQMEAIIIRELSKKQKFRFIKFFKNQSLIVFPVALIIASVSGLLLFLWKGDLGLSYTVGLSLFAGIMSSLLTGAVIPYLFWKMHKDPAEASGPIATVVQDFLSVIVFFYIAQLFF